MVILCLSALGAGAQNTFPVTDKQPANVNGLEMGYIIKSTETKSVGDKGDFSRYAVRFYVTNTTNEAKIILYKQGWNLLNNHSDYLAQFDCLNATGARLTSKQAIISAPACNLLADVDDKDCSTNKTNKNKRFVQVGYWIKPGETINADAIVIVPLNQLPNVQATYLANQLTFVGSASMGQAPPPPVNGGGYMPPPPPSFGFNGELVKIRNLQDNSYINNQDGPPNSTTIQPGWWSAQWQLIRVQGTNRFNIKNRWKGNYLTTDNGSPGLFVNYASDGAQWFLEPSPDGNGFHIRNVSTHDYLCNSPNGLMMAKSYNNVMTSNWVLEQP